MVLILLLLFSRALWSLNLTPSRLGRGVTCGLCLSPWLEPPDATEIFTQNKNENFFLSPCAEWDVSFWGCRLSMSAWEALDLTQGSDGESAIKLWMFLSFSSENLKSNKNVCLFIILSWLTLGSYFIAAIEVLSKKNVACGQLCTR